MISSKAQRLKSIEAERILSPEPGNRLGIVFDISVLDGLQANTSSRTGVFRVVDRLALQLAGRADCRVSFSCNRNVVDIDFLLKKVTQEYPEFAGVTAARIWGPPVTAQRYRTIRGRVRELRGGRPRSLGQKVKLETLRARAALLKRRLRFDAAGLASSSVFHSPWDPLPPRRLFDGTDCRRAVTIYDMTPVLFPNFFQGAEGTLAKFQAILASIAPDDHVIAISECTKRDFCRITGHDPARVYVTPLAADEDMFSVVRDAGKVSAVRRKYGIPEGAYVLSVNTLQPRKNIDHCIQAFVQLVKNEHIRGLSLVLVGDRGWETRAIDEALRAAGLAEHQIVSTGYVPDEDLAPLYSGALAFVYVSHYEGFGLPPLEAMQCGIPVIASDNSSLPEVVGDAGLLVKATDREALCAALLALYRDPSLRAACAARATERARQFSWSKCADLTVDAYRQMLETPPLPTAGRAHD